MKPDPRDAWTQADYEAGYALAKKYLNDYSRIDQVLNNLDALGKSLSAADAAAQKAGNAALRTQIGAAQASRSEVFSVFTADYHNDEDSIQRPGALREDVPGGFVFRGNQPPTPAVLEYAGRFDAAYADAFKKYNAYVASLGDLQAQLRAAGLKPLEGAQAIAP